MEAAAKQIKTRYRVAERLLQGPATATQIAKDTGLARTAVWHHLVAFTRKRLVERKYDRKTGAYLYRIVVDNTTFMKKLDDIRIVLGKRKGGK